MSDYITLLGADDVRSGGYAMERAAADINRAAGNFEAVFERHHRFMEDWLQRFEAVVQDVKILTQEEKLMHERVSY